MAEDAAEFAGGNAGFTFPPIEGDICTPTTKGCTFPMSKEVKDAYFAGLIDGEGYIGMESRGGGWYRPCIRVKMTCQRTIEAIRAHFLVGRVVLRHPATSSPYYKPTHKPQWEWCVTYKGAISVLERIMPYLITKKSIAEEVYAKRFIKKADR